MIRCKQCGSGYPEIGLPYICPDCGGVYDYSDVPEFDAGLVENELPGIWKYRHTFEMPDGMQMVSLGEGNTPLVRDRYEGLDIAYKMEGLNPTGSYKDRVMSVILSQVVQRGIAEAVEDSSGNAGSAFAAYSAKAGVKATVFFPASTSKSKASQIEVYGATLKRIDGPRSAASAAVLQEAQAGAAYASHAYLPFGLRGIATISYEIWEQCGKKAPGTIIAPVGHGHLLRGIMDGFSALKKAGMIDHPPYYVGVQPENCAPVWTAWKQGLSALENLEEKPTIAEGTNVIKPLQLNALLDALQPGKGECIAISEADILAAFYALARRGVYVEPTSAMTWAVLNRIGQQLPQPIVLILTGMGLKYTIKDRT